MPGLSHHLRLDAFAGAMITHLNIRGEPWSLRVLV